MARTVTIIISLILATTLYANPEAKTFMKDKALIKYVSTLDDKYLDCISYQFTINNVIKWYSAREIQDIVGKYKYQLEQNTISVKSKPDKVSGFIPIKPYKVSFTSSSKLVHRTEDSSGNTTSVYKMYDGTYKYYKNGSWWFTSEWND